MTKVMYCTIFIAIHLIIVMMIKFFLVVLVLLHSLPHMKGPLQTPGKSLCKGTFMLQNFRPSDEQTAHQMVWNSFISHLLENVCNFPTTSLNSYFFHFTNNCIWAQSETPWTPLRTSYASKHTEQNIQDHKYNSFEWLKKISLLWTNF